MAKDCWAMEGYIVDADRPCNPEADESACCRVGENCIGSGFCECLQVVNHWRRPAG